MKSGGQWFQCDDARVSPVAAAKVLSAGAYLLFYERQAPRRIVPGALSKAAAATAGPDAAVAAAEAAAAAGERVASPRASSLLRVETAPAALPHLGAEQEMPGLAAAASSAGLSSSSSREQLLLDQAEAQQQAAGALAAGTPQPLHASASEADLPAQRGSGGGVLGSPQEQQEEQEAAAVAARAEVEALLRQHAAQQAGSPRSPASSSDGSSSSGVAPRGNRFDLLCSEEDGSEADSSSGGSSGGDDSDADELHGKSSGSSSTRSSTWCQAGSSRASRSSDWELLEQLPDAAGDSAAAADKPAEEEAGHGSPATLDVPAEAVEQVAEDQAACGSSSSQGPVAPPAPAPAEQAEPDAQQEPRAPGLAQQQQDEQALVSADASADSPAAAAPCCPDHRASLTTVGGCRVLRVSVELPGVQHEEQVDWRLVEAPHADSSACQQMLLRAERWRLALPLPVAVAPGTAVVKRKGHKWTVTMPVL